MKKIFSAIFIILFLLTGCKKLQLEVYDIISPSTFLKTASDAKALVTSCYYDIMHNGDAGMYSYGGTSFPYIFDLSTDVNRCNWGDASGDWATMSLQTYTPTAPGLTSNLWGHYRNISKYTLNIDRIQGMEGVPSLTDELKAQYIAEIKAIRAWCAYLVYNAYGTFPIATLEQLKNPLDEVELERASSETVENLIENDLIEAIAVLPEIYSDAEYGRITKGAAQMILLKFYMMKKNYVAAESTARQIIALNRYGLMENYNEIFARANTRNKELIYSIPSNRSTGCNFWVSWTLPGNFPTQNSTISKWNGYRVTWKFYETFETGDKRLENIFAEYISTTGELITRENDPGGIFNWGPIPLKYGEDPDVNGPYSLIDYVVFRYADVLLSLAESINNNLQGATSEAIGLVNQVRKRAGLADLTSDKIANVSAFNDAILSERRHELYCEGFSREDLIRHGKLIEVLQQFPGNMASENRILYPIPQSAITESKGAIKQNPGYN